MAKKTIITYFLTFIYVSTVVFISCQSVTSCAFTIEGSQAIPTSSVSAQERHHVAFVDIHAIVTIAQFKSLIAMALVGPH